MAFDIVQIFNVDQHHLINRTISKGY